MSTKDILKQIDRRNLFKYLGNSAVALPFMRTLFETEVFGANTAKRAVFFYFPNGMVPENWHATGTGTSFTLPTTTAPLEKIRNDMIIIGGSDFKTNGSHAAGALYCLSAKKEHEKGISIDTHIGEKMKTGVLIPVLRLGAMSFAPPTNNEIVSFAQPGVPSVIQDNPKLAFKQIFGSSGFSLAATDPTAKMKKSLLDYSIDDIQSLEKKLATVEKVKLDSHLQALRELERRVNLQIKDADMPPSNNPGTGGGAKCDKTKDFFSKLKFDDGLDVAYKNENFSLVADIQQELAIQALACGVTNVVYLQLSHPTSEVRMNFIDGPGDQESNHANSHNNLNNHAKSQAYFMNQFAKLIQGMKAVTEGDKTLLYNSIALATSEIGHSANHALTNIPAVLAGQAGGRIVTGRSINAAGGDHGGTLIAMMQALGLPDTTFGNASGVLPGILS